ncbi:lipoprotein, partial [mine drainage metagenome]
FAASPGIGIVALVVVAVSMGVSTIKVVVDANGLKVYYGPFGWPSSRISLARISQASAVDVRPMAWGGWGYRGSMRMLRRAAVVLRRGEGIRLDLADGKIFVVTVDDAETGAQLLNDLVKSAA